MLARAREILTELSEAEQIAVINAHPRIGERPDTVSAASFKEQGYEDDTTPPEVWNGNSSGCGKFLRRISAGSISSFCAAISMMRSIR